MLKPFVDGATQAGSNLLVSRPTIPQWPDKAR
jgi:hypothetical protein